MKRPVRTMVLAALLGAVVAVSVRSGEPRVRIASPYTEPQSWLQANLHTHTVNSDGVATPEEVMAMYHERGYDVIAITDHDIFYRDSVGFRGKMIVIPGQECHLTDPENMYFQHVISLGDTGPIPRQPTLQGLVDRIRGSGGLAVVCHPTYGPMPYEVFEGVECDVFEVYNAAAEELCGNGVSVDYWDTYMTSLGRPRWAVAVDDMHDPNSGLARGWVCVNAARNADSVLDAIARGDAYSSTGPRIHSIRVSDGKITLTFSRAREVRFISARGVVKTVAGGRITTAGYRPTGKEVYVRAEICDGNGGTAWTNPFFISTR